MKHSTPISKAFLDSRTGTERFLMNLNAFMALGLVDLLKKGNNDTQ